MPRQQVETIRILKVDRLGDSKKRELKIVNFGRGAVLVKQEYYLGEDGSWEHGKLKFLTPADVEHIIAHSVTVLELLGSNGNLIQKPLPREDAKPARSGVSKNDSIVRKNSEVRIRVKDAYHNAVVERFGKTTGKIHVVLADGTKFRLLPKDVRLRKKKP